MKKQLLAIVAAYSALIAMPATAADMPVKAKAPPVAADPDWSGAYFGVSLGEAWTEKHQFMPNLPQVGIPPTTFASRSSDLIIDAHAGVQSQWGHWLLGVEGGYSVSPRDMASSVSVSPPEPFTHLAATTRISQIWTVGPRLGVAWGRFMAYGTGGYALAHLSGSYTCADTGIPVFPGPGACTLIFGPVRNFNFGGITWNDGWFAGAGVEFMAYHSSVADVVLGAEYQHFDVGLQTAFVCNVVQCGPTSHQNFLQDARGDILRARLTIKTGGWGFMGFGSSMVARK